MFADDIVIMHADSNFATCNAIIQSEFNIVNEWCHDNGMCINRKKTVCMLMCPSLMRENKRLEIKCHSVECLHNFEIGCKCENIEQVKSCIYLGLHLDEEFTWQHQIKHIVSKLRSVLREINFVGSHLDSAAKRTLYHALAHSHLNYGIAAWGSVNLSPISNMQEKILYKMLTRKQKRTVENYFGFWKVLPVKKVFDVTVLCMKYFEPHGDRREHNYETRLSQFEPLVMPPSKNKFSERTFNHVVPRLWNKLPLQHRNYETMSEVKRNLKKFYKSEL
jgi:hypothetical protein